MKIKAAQPVNNYRSNLERRYARHLEMLRLAAEISDYKYEVWTFRLAERCTYTPDFLVWMPDGSAEMHEVKGFRGAHGRNDSTGRAKIRIAADMFPQIVFRLIEKPSLKERAKYGEWKITTMPPHNKGLK